MALFLHTNSKKDGGAKTTAVTNEQRRVMELLGQEFHLVDKGLDPAEVMAFLESLTGSTDAILKRLENFASMTRLSATIENALEEAHQACNQIKERAVKEAEAEKSRLIEEAKRKAEEVVDDTRKRCWSMIESTKAILTEAKSKSQEMIDRTRKGCACLIEDTSSVLDGAAVDLVAAANKARQTQELALQRVKESGEVRVKEVHQNLEKLGKSVNNELFASLSKFELEFMPSGAPIGFGKMTAVQEQRPELEAGNTNGHQARDAGPVIIDGTRYVTTGSSIVEMPGPGGSVVNGQEAAKKDAESEELMASRLYHGETVVKIMRGVGFQWLTQLIGAVKRIPGVEIMSYSGNPDGSYLIKLFLSRPITLASILKEMPFIGNIAYENADKRTGEPAGSAAGLSEATNETLVILPKASSNVIPSSPIPAPG